MLLTIVLWWVPAAAILIFAGCIIYDEYKNRKPDWVDALGAGLFILAIGWIGGGFIWLFLTLILTAIPSGEPELVKTETYTVADSASFEYKDDYYVKFISVDRNGKFEPQYIKADETIVELFGGKTVEVKTYDNYHRWLNPWVMSTDIHVTIK